MKIDMKKGIVTIGNIVINMRDEIILIDEEEVDVKRKSVRQTTIDDFVDDILPEIPTRRVKKEHVTLTAKQRKKFKKKRMDWVDETIVMPDNTTWTVESHVKGSQYVIVRTGTRGGNKRKLGTSFVERADASHSDAKGWRYWEDRGEEGHSHDRTPEMPPDYFCSVCGMKNANKATCKSILSTDGTWLQQHEMNYNKEKYLSDKNKEKEE